MTRDITRQILVFIAAVATIIVNIIASTLPLNGLNTGECGLTDGSNAGDWRLPNYKELISLIDVENYLPALPSGHPFNNVLTSYYWSSSTYAPYSLNAWIVYMDAGSVTYDFKSYGDYYVWPVRGGH